MNTPTHQEALELAEEFSSVPESDEPQTAQDTPLAKGSYRAFFERNKEGIQYVRVTDRTYFIARGWTLHGPIPTGARVEHTGLAGYKDSNVYNAQGFKRTPKVRTGGTHSKRRRHKK